MRVERPRAAVLVTITIGMLILASCGSSGGSGSSGSHAVKSVTCSFPQQSPAVTVNVLAYDSAAVDPFTNEMVNSCSKNGVTVQHAPSDFSGQYEKTATTLAGSRGTYDIIEMYSAAVPRYGATGKLVDLDPYFQKYKDKYDLGDLQPAMLKGLSFGGHLYALPMQANVMTLVYRKDVFSQLKLQPPKTYADLLKDAQAIQKSGKMQYPVALPFNDNTSSLYESLMASQGKTYVDSDGKPTFETAQSETALKALADLRPYMDPQVISYDQPRVQQQLFNGKAAIAIMYSGRMSDLLNANNTTYSSDFAFAAPPSAEPGGKPASLVSVDGWSIAKNSAVNPDLLFQIIAASTAPAAAKQAIPAAYPSRKSVTASEKAAYFPAVQDAFAGGATTTSLTTWLGSMQTATAPVIQQVVTGQISVSAAQSQCQRLATPIVKS